MLGVVIAVCVWTELLFRCSWSTLCFWIFLVVVMSHISTNMPTYVVSYYVQYTKMLSEMIDSLG